MKVKSMNQANIYIMKRLVVCQRCMRSFYPVLAETSKLSLARAARNPSGSRTHFTSHLYHRGERQWGRYLYWYSYTHLYDINVDLLLHVTYFSRSSLSSSSDCYHDGALSGKAHGQFFALMNSRNFFHIKCLSYSKYCALKSSNVKKYKS